MLDEPTISPPMEQRLYGPQARQEAIQTVSLVLDVMIAQNSDR